MALASSLYLSRKSFAPYKENDTFLTQTREAVYAIAKGGADSVTCEQKITKVVCLNDGKEVAFTQANDKVMLTQKAEANEEYTVLKLYKEQ